LHRPNFQEVPILYNRLQLPIVNRFCQDYSSNAYLVIKRTQVVWRNRMVSGILTNLNSMFITLRYYNGNLGEIAVVAWRNVRFFRILKQPWLHIYMPLRYDNFPNLFVLIWKKFRMLYLCAATTDFQGELLAEVRYSCWHV